MFVNKCLWAFGIRSLGRRHRALSSLYSTHFAAKEPMATKRARLPKLPYYYYYSTSSLILRDNNNPSKHHHPSQKSEGALADRHASVLLAQTPDELEAAYDTWAHQYEDDLAELSGLGGGKWGQSAMRVMKKYCTPCTHPRLLDFGCGPGMAGPWFRAMGWNPDLPGNDENAVSLDGNDLSQKMLDVAKKKGCYTKLIKSSFEDSGVSCNYYDVIHCHGVIAPGQAPPSVFDEFIKLLKPGGLAVFTARTGYFDGEEGAQHKAYLEELIRRKKWEMISQTEEEYLPKENLTCYVFVMKKL